MCRKTLGIQWVFHTFLPKNYIMYSEHGFQIWKPVENIMYLNHIKNSKINYIFYVFIWFLKCISRWEIIPISQCMHSFFLHRSTILWGFLDRYHSTLGTQPQHSPLHSEVQWQTQRLLQSRRPVLQLWCRHCTWYGGSQLCHLAESPRHGYSKMEQRLFNCIAYFCNQILV